MPSPWNSLTRRPAKARIEPQAASKYSFSSATHGFGRERFGDRREPAEIDEHRRDLAPRTAELRERRVAQHLGHDLLRDSSASKLRLMRSRSRRPATISLKAPPSSSKLVARRDRDPGVAARRRPTRRAARPSAATGRVMPRASAPSRSPSAASRVPPPTASSSREAGAGAPARRRARRAARTRRRRRAAPASTGARRDEEALASAAPIPCWRRQARRPLDARRARPAPRERASPRQLAARAAGDARRRRPPSDRRAPAAPSCSPTNATPCSSSSNRIGRPITCEERALRARGREQRAGSRSLARPQQRRAAARGRDLAQRRSSPRSSPWRPGSQPCCRAARPPRSRPARRRSSRTPAARASATRRRRFASRSAAPAPSGVAESRDPPAPARRSRGSCGTGDCSRRATRSRRRGSARAAASSWRKAASVRSKRSLRARVDAAHRELLEQHEHERERDAGDAAEREEDLACGSARASSLTFGAGPRIGAAVLARVRLDPLVRDELELDLARAALRERHAPGSRAPRPAARRSASAAPGGAPAISKAAVRARDGVRPRFSSTTT